MSTEELAAVEYCYLTTTGRVTGRPHEIEIWFGLVGNTAYLLSGGGAKSDWVKNLRKEPRARLRIDKQTFDVLGRIVTDPEEEARARHALASKYDEYEDDGSPSEWASTALPVALDLQM